MKGSFFQRPLEFRLTTHQDEFIQGMSLNGTLEVINQGSTEVVKPALHVAIAFQNFNDFKKKGSQADDVLYDQELAQNVIVPPQGKQQYAWSFLLPTDCPIIDKQSSLFLLYGDQDYLTGGSRIDLRVGILKLIESYFQTLTTQFHFVLKATKNHKGFIEVKLDPPDSLDYPTLEQAMCYIRLKDGQMEVEYQFKIKSMGKKDENNIKVVTRKREIKQVFADSDYLTAGGYPNRDIFRKSIQDALEVAKPKAIF